MEKNSRFVGLDVHAETIAVAVAEPSVAAAIVRYLTFVLVRGTEMSAPSASRKCLRFKSSEYDSARN